MSNSDDTASVEATFISDDRRKHTYTLTLGRELCMVQVRLDLMNPPRRVKFSRPVDIERRSMDRVGQLCYHGVREELRSTHLDDEFSITLSRIYEDASSGVNDG
jgi:hypothetical protein